MGGIFRVGAVLLCLVGPAALAQPAQSDKENLIRELLQITGSEKLALQQANFIVPELVKAIRPLFPGVPPEAFAIMEDELRQSIAAELPAFVAATGKVYDKYYSHEDLVELLRFYKSPVGQRMLASLPLIVQDTSSAGAIWGQQVGRQAAMRAIEKLKSLGYQPKAL